MKWLLVVLVFNFNTGTWNLSKSQPPAIFPNAKSNNALSPEEDCKFWAKTIQEGWKRVTSSSGKEFVYSATCTEVLSNK